MVAVALLHSLPLDKSLIFEVSLTSSTNWSHDQGLPHSREWAHLSLNKATDVARCAAAPRPNGRQRVCFFNHGTGFGMAARKYFFKSEQNGVYHFAHCNDEYPDIVVRESIPKGFNLTVQGSNVVVRGALSGNIVYEYTGQPGDTLRLLELRGMIKRVLINDGIATPVTTLKLVRAGTTNVIRGNTVILRGAPARARNLHAQRRTLGQSVITHFFGRFRLL